MARKTYQGEKNDKGRTMSKLIQSVGIVLEEKGYTGLTVTNIAKTAGLDRKLISIYFGDLDTLISTYIKSKDYWITATEGAGALLTDSKINLHAFHENMLLNQIDQFTANIEMQKVVLWQLSENSEIMSHVAQSREKMSALFFPYADKQFTDEQIDLRAITSLLVAGINYLVLHTKTTDSTFCEIDLMQKEGMDRIKEAIKFILNKTYNQC